MRQLSGVTLAGLVSLGAALALGAMLAGARSGERDALAARYNTRSRTDRFFDRANPPRAASSRQTADEETAADRVGSPAPNADSAKPQAARRRVAASQPVTAAKPAVQAEAATR